MTDATMPALVAERRSACGAAFLDIRQGLARWRIWWLLGIGDVRQRYRRSRLGQFWLTLSMAIFVGSIGVLYANLFRQPIAEYLPYLSINFVVWSLMTGIMLDGGSAFTQSEGFLRQEAFPKSLFVIRVLVRHFVAFAHNVPVPIIVFWWFGKSPSWVILAAPAGLLLLGLAGFLVALASGILCTRFRDLPQILQSLVQVLFFVTPVTWIPEQLGARALDIVRLNPFALFLRLVADPVRGRLPPPSDYAAALLILLVMGAAVLPLFAKYRARIVYWL